MFIVSWAGRDLKRSITIAPQQNQIHLTTSDHFSLICHWKSAGQKAPKALYSSAYRSLLQEKFSCYITPPSLSFVVLISSGLGGTFFPSHAVELYIFEDHYHINLKYSPLEKTNILLVSLTCNSCFLCQWSLCFLSSQLVLLSFSSVPY